MSRLPTAVFLVLLPYLVPAAGHGRLTEPPSRATAWRYGFPTPPNYNDHELYCGGFSRQWQRNGGKCGVCGDAWDLPPPRPHEFGGTYGQGVVVRKYRTGTVITVRVELTANHNGYFEFGLCPDYVNATQDCLDRHAMRAARPTDADHPGRYYPRDGNKLYDIKYRLPDGLACRHCLMQWRYVAGNNWGTCPNGTGIVGCGPQEEFRACADVSIGDGDGDGDGEGESDDYTTTVRPDVVVRPDYSPLPSIVVTVVSLLTTFLVLAVLYVHYYNVGRRLKAWLKGTDDPMPVPPPRTRRKQDHGDGESNA